MKKTKKYGTVTVRGRKISLEPLKGPLKRDGRESVFDFNLKQAEAIWLWTMGWRIAEMVPVKAQAPMALTRPKDEPLWEHGQFTVCMTQSTAVITEKSMRRWYP